MNLIIYIAKHYRHYKPITKLAIWSVGFTLIGIVISLISFYISSFQSSRIEHKIDKVLNENKKISDSLPQQHVIFAIKNFQIVPQGKTPEEFSIDWATGAVKEITPKHIVLIAPNIKFRNRLFFYGNTYVIPYRPGKTVQSGTLFGPYHMAFTVIGADKDLIVMGMSFIPWPVDKPKSN